MSNEDIQVLGIIRTTTTRHGSGPLPTCSKELTDKLVDVNNPTNPWQLNFRVGHFDFPLFNYACDVVKREYKLDGIVLNHLDQINSNVCTRYNGLTEELKYRGPNLKRQEQLGYRLWQVKPYLEQINETEFLATISKQAPITIVGRGPTYLDRTSL